MSLGQKTFSGWSPNDDLLNGNKSALVRCDNGTLDELGAVSQINGAAKITDVQGIEKVYSLFVGASKQRYAGLGLGIILRDFVAELGASGVAQWAFGSGFGEVFISSGALKLKDSGPGLVLPWGLHTPGGAPLVSINTSPFVNWAAPASYTGFTAVEGTITLQVSGNIQATVNGTTNRLILQNVGLVNLSLFSDGGMQEDGDLFSINVLVPDSQEVLSVRVEALLQVPGAGVSDTQDYYYFEWFTDSNASFVAGIQQWSTLNCTRVDFQRQGNTAGLDWSNVQAVRVIYNLSLLPGAADLTCQLGVPFNFTGGSNAQLFGGQGTNYTPYELFQVNVYNSGAYIGASPISPITPQFTAMATSINITPYTAGIDSQVNEIWFYLDGGTLTTPYFIGKSIKSGITFPVLTYGDSDADAILENIVPNLFLASILDLTDNVLDIEGPCNGRMVLMTSANIIFTDYLNPESYDSRMVLTLSGALGEVNLFMSKIGLSTLLVGTNKDVYQITGTFQQLPDGTFDVSISALGLEQPPINPSYCIRDYTLYYMASDGIKSLAFSLSQTVSGQIQSLWRGETRYGVPGLLTTVNTKQNQLAYAKGKLAFIADHSGGAYSIFEWDLGVTKAWNRRLAPGNLVPSFVYGEPDGVMLIGYPEGVYQTDQGHLWDTTAQPISLQFAVQDGGEPFQRKELLTLNLSLQGGPVDISLINEQGVTYPVATNQTGDGIHLLGYPLEDNGANLSRRLGLIVTGLATGSLYIRDWEVDYIVLPIQSSYSKILPTNLGTSSRKRFLQYAIILDTLGTPCTLTIIVDGNSQPSISIDTDQDGKSTVVYTFKSEVIGIEISHTISAEEGRYFEYYGLALEECISEKMPPLSQYLVIPQNNFEILSKKRVRVLPMIINTFGQDILFTPIVDGIADTSNPTLFNTLQKQTVYYYFTDDSFGTDYGGILEYHGGTVPEGPLHYAQGQFEFYGLQAPTVVEKLPTPRLFEQLGPFQVDRVGKFLEIRYRVLSFTPSLSCSVYLDDVLSYSIDIVTKVGIDTVYNVKLPKGLIGTIFRCTFSSPDTTQPFYSWQGQFRLQDSGMASQDKWVTVKG